MRRSPLLGYRGAPTSKAVGPGAAHGELGLGRALLDPAREIAFQVDRAALAQRPGQPHGGFAALAQGTEGDGAAPGRPGRTWRR